MTTIKDAFWWSISLFVAASKKMGVYGLVKIGRCNKGSAFWLPDGLCTLITAPQLRLGVPTLYVPNNEHTRALLTRAGSDW